MSIRLAQTFDVYSAYAPTKASLYLKKIGADPKSYFDLTSGIFSIDASNYSHLNQATTICSFRDTVLGFTGNGYIANTINNGSPYPVVEYPILTENPRKYNIYLRMQSPSGTISADILIDGVRVAGINDTASSNTWTWFRTDFAIGDKKLHNLGIRLKETSLSLDKIYLNDQNTTVSGVGPDLTQSPFTTLHLQVYESDGTSPTTSLDIYDFKTTIEEITIDDWYNFSLTPLDKNASITFDSSYALVLSASGGSSDNYVVWDFVDNDEYTVLPSSILIK